MARPISNRSFEDQGLNPGQADQWTELVSSAAEEVADFQHSTTYTVPWDDFEDSWESNHLSQYAFAVTGLVSAMFEDDSRQIEDFEYSWREPATGSPVTYNHQGTLVFAAVNFTLAYFGVLEYESFEVDWGSSPYVQASIYLYASGAFSLAQFDTGADDEEDFENTWGSYPYNQSSVYAFSLLNMAVCTFDVAGDFYEDFETEWYETLP